MSFPIYQSENHITKRLKLRCFVILVDRITYWLPFVQAAQEKLRGSRMLDVQLSKRDRRHLLSEFRRKSRSIPPRFRTENRYHFSWKRSTEVPLPPGRPKT